MVGIHRIRGFLYYMILGNWKNEGILCALHKSAGIELAKLPFNECIKMPTPGCCVYQLWTVINSWPPLLPLMP